MEPREKKAKDRGRDGGGGSGWAKEGSRANFRAIRLFDGAIFMTLGKWATAHEDAFIWPRAAPGLCCLDK